MSNKHIAPMTWQEHESELLKSGRVSQDEIDESNARVAIISELINARNEKKITQRKLEELTGVRKSTITRMETGQSSPALDTVLRALAPLGKTLTVTPISHGK